MVEGVKLLIVEDSERLVRALSRGLRKVGHTVDVAEDGETGWLMAETGDYDVVVLDVMLPGCDGIRVVERLRAQGRETHVLILSARDAVDDRVRGLKAGADDYLVKPFSFDELCARVDALGRRKYATKNPVLEVGPLEVRTAERRCYWAGTPVPLTRGEYALVECLVRRRGRVMSKEQLGEALHDWESDAGTNVVEVLVCNIRKKLRQIGCGPDQDVIVTRRGFGYVVE